jgi:hypothetical protein
MAGSARLTAMEQSEHYYELSSNLYALFASVTVKALAFKYIERGARVLTL